MNGICTCVNFDDVLKIVLPQNARHFEHVLVVTSLDDTKTVEVVASVSNAECFRTSEFYADNARFNKAAALDAGLEVLGKNGWIVIFDSDVLMPRDMDVSGIEIGHLYSPYRRMCEDQKLFTPDLEWSDLPLGYEVTNGEYAGYYQLFNANDPVLPKDKPWHGTTWKTAQGADTIMQNHWPKSCRKRLPFEVLHLGPLKVNWAGRVSPRWDLASKENGP